MQALVTGATGLIGSHVVQTLLAQNHRVKALLRPASNADVLTPYAVEVCFGDMLSPDSLIAAAKGCDIIYHTAGAFSYWGYEAKDFISEAVTGMKNILAAAVANNTKRVVFTSSSVTIGATDEPVVLDETHTGRFEEVPAYVKAKVLQEKTAFALGAQYGLDVIAICPTLTVGGINRTLTESNRIIVNYLNDPFKATWIGGCNMVGVRDVAAGMVLLGTRGQAGERYIAGSDNLTWQQVHRLLSQLCGLPGPYMQAYHTSSYLMSAFQEAWSLLTKERPLSTREQAKMVGNYYWYASEKLRQLGYRPQSSEQALIEAVSALVASAHIPPSVRATMRLSDKIYQFRHTHSSV